jgi:iron complex outermembrane receptor protein
VRKDQIASVDEKYLLAHEDELPGSVVRNPDGTINHINIRGLNIASGEVWGIDATGKYRTLLGEIGQLVIDGTYSWLPHIWIAPTSDVPPEDNAGLYMQPKSRARLSFSLDRGPWRSTLTFNYTGKYLRATSPSALNCPFDASGTNRPELCSVKAWRTIDLFVGYTAFQQLELGLLVTNVDNVQAPFDANQVPANFSTYQSSFHSAVGRFFKLTARYTFR